MKAARLHAIGDFRIDEVEIPKITGEQLLVKVGACGICGSDLPRVYQLGTSNKHYPLTIGHEFSGEIVDVGPDGDKSLIGKKGAFFPLIPCMKCDMCNKKEYVLCEDYDYMGSRRDGAFAEYIAVPSSWHFVETKNNASYKSLAMCEPCSVAGHATNIGQIKENDFVVIFGGGPIGIMAARWCLIKKAKPIIFDIMDEKIEFAKQRGIDAYNSAKENCAEIVKDINNGKLADVAIEGTGAGSALGNCIECLKRKGNLVLMGNPFADSQIKLSQHSLILRKELVVKGIWNSHFPDEWQTTVEKIDNGEMIVEDLITHTCSIDGVVDLFDKIHNKEICICKAMYVNGE